MTTLVNDGGMGPRELLESLAQEQGPGGLISAAWVLDHLNELTEPDLPRLSLSPLDPADALAEEPPSEAAADEEPEPKEDPAKSLKPAPGAKPVRKAQGTTVT